jgi:hypothetical protein
VIRTAIALGIFEFAQALRGLHIQLGGFSLGSKGYVTVLSA